MKELERQELTSLSHGELVEKIVALSEEIKVKQRQFTLDNGRLRANIAKVEAERDRFMLKLHQSEVQLNNIRIIINN